MSNLTPKLRNKELLILLWSMRTQHLFSKIIPAAKTSAPVEAFTLHCILFTAHELL